jgi:formylglycine-generating enzyme required for sulfatase activity
VAGPAAWYFHSGHREASASPSVSSAPSQVRENPKAEPALPPRVSSHPDVVVADTASQRHLVIETAGSSPPVRTNLKDGLKYVFIPAGKFVMGCSPGDTECDIDEKPPHAEQIANGFWLGQTEVTQAAWKKVNNSDNPSHFKGDELPVESVDWSQATAYCQAIGGRLPTEREWEYAARAGAAGSRYGALDAVAWYSANSGGTTHPVGLKQANAFGLYDVLGNVWEWTSDNYNAVFVTVRGVSWHVFPKYVRASFRGGRSPSNQSNDLGFRCVGELR